MLAGAGFKYVTAVISGTNTYVDIGVNTHGLTFTPVVYNIVPLRTTTTGEANPAASFWWDKTAASNLDGGNSVRIATNTAPGGSNVYRLAVLLGPATPGSILS